MFRWRRMGKMARVKWESNRAKINTLAAGLPRYVTNGPRSGKAIPVKVFQFHRCVSQIRQTWPTFNKGSRRTPFRSNCVLIRDRLFRLLVLWWIDPSISSFSLFFFFFNFASLWSRSAWKHGAGNSCLPMEYCKKCLSPRLLRLLSVSICSKFSKTYFCNF